MLHIGAKLKVILKDINKDSWRDYQKKSQVSTKGDKGEYLPSRDGGKYTLYKNQLISPLHAVLITSAVANKKYLKTSIWVLKLEQ